MCYTGSCPYESYPYGRNEGCVCRKPRYEECYLEQNDEEDEDNLDPDSDGIEDDIDESEYEVPGSGDNFSNDINGLSPEGEKNLDQFDIEMSEDEDELYDD